MNRIALYESLLYFENWNFNYTNTMNIILITIRNKYRIKLRNIQAKFFIFSVFYLDSIKIEIEYIIV